MTPAETTARLIVLETYALTALTLALADGGEPRARSLLDHLHGAAVGLAAEIGPGVEIEATRYSAHMAELVLENLRNGDGGR